MRSIALDDLRTELPENVDVQTISNTATPGLAGGRNSGLAAATGELVAFCDDDDEWAPAKLRAQVALWAEHPDAVGVSTGITIVTATTRTERIPGLATSRSDFLESRVGEIHPSSLLFRRADLLALPGGVDEQIPFSYGEDYDLLLRLSEHGDIVSVPEPLVIIHWDRTSYFAGRWEAVAAGLSFLLDKHPDLLKNRANAARMCGQVAFAHAAAGNQASAKSWARRAVGYRRAEPRAWLTYVTLTGLVSPDRIVSTLNRAGRGM